MLQLRQYEEMTELLLTLTEKVMPYHEVKDPRFADAAEEWLGDLEQALSNNRMVQSAQLAVSRAQVRGLRRPGSRAGQRPRRAERDAAIVAAIRASTDLLGETLEPEHARFAEADALARNVLIVAQHKGILPADRLADTQRLRWLHDSLARDSDVGAGIVKIDALVGPTDALVILGRRLVDVEPTRL